MQDFKKAQAGLAYNFKPYPIIFRTFCFESGMPSEKMNSLGDFESNPGLPGWYGNFKKYFHSF